MNLKNTKYFFIAFIIFLFFSSIILFSYPKQIISIKINEMNSPFLDFFFKYITHLGSGILLVAFIIIFLLFDKKTGFIGIISSILVLLTVYIMKAKIFAERPISYFQYSFKTDYIFHYVDGVDVHHYSSFPSGHTATAFALFLLLSFFWSNKISQIVFFTLALLVGYSRLYLSQHFLTDVVVGALIGVFSVYLSSFILNKLFPNISSNGFLKTKKNA